MCTILRAYMYLFQTFEATVFLLKLININVCYYSKNVQKKLNVIEDKYMIIVGYCPPLLLFSIFYDSL